MSKQITDSQDEQSIDELLRDADQIHIPIFQREYVWKKKEFDDLIHDLEVIKDIVDGCAFLGAVVSNERPRPKSVKGRLKALDIVDGQQRLLTLYIFILAISERIHFYDPGLASTYIQDYLLLPERDGLTVNTRIVPSLKDRSQFRVLWNRVYTPEKMKGILDKNPPKPPLPSGNSTGSLIKQYARIIKWLKSTTPSTPIEASFYLQDILEIVTNKLVFVHLKLTDPSVATKIFERLNFRGVRVGVFDLVRNEVFSRTSQDADASLETYETLWRPFEANFKSREEGFFFPYCLIHNSNIKKSELFSELRKIWKSYDPKPIIEHMIPYQVPYLALVLGEPNYPDKKINDCIIRLHRLKIPSAIYPFLIKILFEYNKNNLNKNITIQILEFVEAFLVRRAIVGFEPTGLHALFKGVWEDISSNPTKASLKKEIIKRPTIQYPTNKQLKEAIKTRPLANSRICSFILRELDVSIKGDTPSDPISIEHVLPNIYPENNEWGKLFNKDQHKTLKDTIANLIPLSIPLNSSIQNRPYKEKQERYLNESMFISAREFAKKWNKWDIESIEKRSTELYEWIKNRWSE